MTTITINERTTEGKVLLKMLEPFNGTSYLTFGEEKRPSAGLLKSIEEAKTGKVTKFKNSSELMSHLQKKINV